MYIHIRITPTRLPTSNPAPPPRSSTHRIASHLLSVLDAELLVDLELHGQAVAVPPEAPHDVMAPLVRVPRHRVLDRPRQEVPYDFFWGVIGREVSVDRSKGAETVERSIHQPIDRPMD